MNVSGWWHPPAAAVTLSDFSFIEARQAVERQQEITAATLLSQAEHISDLAWDMTGHLRAFSNRPCADINSQLQKLGTLNPYFRSVA